MKPLILLLIICFSFISCSEENVNPVTEESLKLMVNKLEFSINEPIEVNLVNQGNSSVFLYHCNFKVKPDIEKKENGIWIIYYSPVCLAVYPSGLNEFKLGNENKNTMVVDESGTFRIKYSYSLSYVYDLDKSVYSEELLVK